MAASFTIVAGIIQWTHSAFSKARRWASTSPARATRPRFVLLGVEVLEPRRLLATAWTAIGPDPQYDNYKLSGDAKGQPVAGRISALAVSSYLDAETIKQAMYVGTASGGVLRSTDFTNADPTTIHWTSLTDCIAATVEGNYSTGFGSGIVDTGSIAVVPATEDGANLLQAKVYVGTGEAKH